MLFSQSVLVAAVFAVVAFSATFSIPSVYADVAPCYDIVGYTTVYPSNGVANSGIINFNAAYEPSSQYAACSRSVGNGTVQLEGWVWNTNLGWISLRCADEDNDAATVNTNATVSCGTETYGVTMDLDDGQLHGYAWGDAIGWISFNCADDAGGCTAQNNHLVRAETDLDCPGGVYSSSTYPTPPNCPDHVVEDAFAWSDSVGWFDMSGIAIPFTLPVDPLPEIIPVPADVSFTVDAQVYPDPNTVVNVPVANNSDQYEVRVAVNDALGASVVDGAQYNIDITPVWAEDTVKMDQTVNGATGNYSANNNGAVTKPLDDNAFTAGGDFNAGAGYYYGVVTSKAPTTNMNVYDDASDTFAPVNNETFYLPASGFDHLEPNNLRLAGVDLKITDIATGNCVLPPLVPPAVGPCTMAASFPVSTGNDFKFAPATAVTMLKNTSAQVPNNILHGQNSVQNQVLATSVCNLDSSGCANVNIMMQAGIDAPYTLTFDDNDPLTMDGSILSFITSGTQTLKLLPSCSGGCVDGENPYLYSLVDIGSGVFGQNVKYYSAKLPRARGNFVMNPVASISGNIYSTGTNNASSQVTIRSLGDVSTNLLRDTIFRNVSRLTTGITPPAATPVTLVADGNGGFSGGGVPLMVDAQGAKVYYFTGDVTLDDNGASDHNIPWTGERTIITMGGNVFVKGNLYNEAVGTKPELGIIALKDLVTGQGGNVYITPEVTDIQANIFTDGSFFSCDDSCTINANGEPVFADEPDRFNKLANQLYIEGSIASSNTIGGATKNPPIIGNGQEVPATEGGYTPTASGRSQARLYDFNFLRYYGYAYERDPMTGDAIDQQHPAYLASDPGYSIQATPVAQGGDLVLIPGGAPSQGLDNTQNFNVHVVFDPPSASLPGFGVSSGAEVKFN